MQPSVTLRTSTRRPQSPRYGRPVPFFSFQNVPFTIGLVGLLFYAFIVISFKLNIAGVAITIAILGALIEGPIRFPRPLQLLTLFLAWVALGSLQSIDPSLSSDAVVVDAKLVLVAFAIANILRSQGQLQWFMLVYTGTFFPFAVLLSMFWFVTGGGHAGRATGYQIYGNSNDLGALALLGIAMMLAVAQAAEKQRFVRLIYIGMSVVTALLITMTQSRAALIGLAVGFVPLLAGVAIKNWRVLLATPILVALIIAYAPSNAWTRLSGLKDFSTTGDNQLDAEGSAGQRWLIAKTAMQITKDNPAFGVGRGTYPIAQATYTPATGQMDTHNTYLNLAAETGVPGLLIYLLFVGTVLTRCTQAIRALRKTVEGRNTAAVLRWLRAGLLGFLAAAIFGSYTKLNLPLMYFMLLWVYSDWALQRARSTQPRTVAFA